MENKLVNKIRKRQKIGDLGRKILLVLLAGYAISHTSSNKKQWKIIKEVYKEFKECTNYSLDRASDSLFKSRLIEEQSDKEGTTLVLTQKGRQYALAFDMENTKLLHQEKWDGKWRIVIYDIPIRLNKVRESLRYQLKRIGMKEIQQSVFVYPYPCHKEIKYIIEFYFAWKYIHFLEAAFINGEDKIKKHFKL